MPMLTVNHIRILFCSIGAIILCTMALVNYYEGQTIVALFTCLLALVLVINGISMVFRSANANTTQTDALFLVLLASFSLFSADMQGSHTDWTYFFPIAAYFLFSLRTAILCVLAFTPIAIYIFIQYGPTLIQAQSIFSFAAVSCVALFLAMVKSRTNQLLEPLISSDETTGAQLESFLRPALKKEINRAEREGTGLLLVYLKFQKHNRGLPSDIIMQCANAIASQLRLFDQYYRLNKDQFAIIMPHANTDDALTKVKFMVSEMPPSLQGKVEVGLASLNVGDTEETLILQAQQELTYV
ncbi:hypothetical protein NBRC116188_18200 [Oceaniserpentilla sp. 4NH20-0058]|uniref:GGDEF domain-containing protein n=1 Tax=Oceaniserpentilla sp. 4NH20-0058 TaxID=3127660 RepID=UPI00310A0BDF